MKTFWVCDTCYQLPGKEFEIFTIPNWLDLPCVICGERADHLVRESTVLAIRESKAKTLDPLNTELFQ